VLRRLRPRSAYDVMAALALFVAVSTGGAYAANTVFSSDIVDGEVKTADLADGAVTRNKLGSSSVTNGKINNEAVNGGKVADGSLTAVDLSASGTFAGQDIGRDPQGLFHVVDNGISSSEVADNSLTGSDINESTLDDAGLHSGACESKVNDVMVRVGPLCMDRYEASVWSSPTGGTQYGLNGDDYPCNDTGNNCRGEIYARSVAGAEPSAFITWFQAQQALANSGKRLPTSAEWQMAAAGTPSSSALCPIDEGGAAFVAPAGSFAGCISDWGINDMAGNVDEWVADWVPRSSACPGWDTFSNDEMCLAGATTGFPGPGALTRGGNNLDGTGAGPFTVGAFLHPQDTTGLLGFRGAR
jgi:hypothetical protein